MDLAGTEADLATPLQSRRDWSECLRFCDWGPDAVRRDAVSLHGRLRRL